MSIRRSYKRYLDSEDSEYDSTRLLQHLRDRHNINQIECNETNTENAEEPCILEDSLEDDFHESNLYGSDISCTNTIEKTDFCIEDYLSDESVDDSEYFSQNRKPKNLQEYVESENFFKKVNSLVDKTVGELFLMILKFSVINNLSTTALTNLFQLVNSIFAEPVLPNSRYLIDVVLNTEKGAEFHATCDGCSAYLGKLGNLKNVNICTSCKAVELDLKNSSDSNFFVLIDCSAQVSFLLNTYQKHYDYVLNNRVYDETCIKDIYDGEKYRQFVNSLPENEKRNYVTFVFNTDGAPKFESSQTSIYPMYFMINEIPAQQRLDNLVICGLWFNKKKPDLNIVLTPVVEAMNTLTRNGIKCSIKGKEVLVKPYLLTCCVDSVARAPIQGIKQFNGNFGCNWCLHPGEWADGSMRYPYLQNPIEERDHQLTINDMLIATPENPINGIKCPSPFINLTGFHIIWGFTPDYMHCCLEGVGKQVAEYLLKQFTRSELQRFDEKIKAISVPYQISRLTRKITERNNWKAREWENFILYYSVPLLSPKIEKKLLNFWMLFVKSLHILLDDHIYIHDLYEADYLLQKFVIETGRLFDIKAMSYNVHQLLHVCKSVLNWGPLWAQSTYCFESANYKVLRVIKCAKGVTHQVLRFVHLNESIRILEEHVIRKASDTIKFYCDDILTVKLRNVTKIKSNTYIGKGNEVDDRVANNFNPASRTRFFKRIVKDGCLYTGQFKRNKRSNNSFAQLRNGEIIKIVNFCIDNGNNVEFTLCQLVNTQREFPNCTKIMKIIDIKEDIISVMTIVILLK